MAEVSPCLSPVSRAGARGLRLDPGGGKKRWPSRVGSGLSSYLRRESTLTLECLGTSCRKSPGGMGGRGLGRKEEKKREIRREKATEREGQDAAGFPRSLRREGAGGRSLEPSADGGLGGGCPQIGRASLWGTAAPTQNGPGTPFYSILYPAEKPPPSDPWLG